MKVLIIIPAYNEEINIKNVVDNIIENYPQYEYIVVNDGSTDGTEKVCKGNNYNYISLPVNLGIGGCVQTGYLYSVKEDYDIAIQLDGDGQHNPQFIESLIEPIIKGQADMVIGSRFLKREGFQTTLLRRVGIRFIKSVIKFCCGMEITDTTSGFRATNKSLNAFFADNYAQDYPEPEAIVASVLSGYKVQEMPVIMNERLGGVSSISGFKSAYYMIKVSLALLLYHLGIAK